MCIVQNIPSCSILFIFSLMCRRRRCRRRSSTWVFAYVCPENEHVCSSHNTYSLSFSPSLRNLKKKPSLHLYFSETFLRAVGNSIFQCVFRDHTVRTETLLLWNRERESKVEKKKMMWSIFKRMCVLQQLYRTDFPPDEIKMRRVPSLILLCLLFTGAYGAYDNSYGMLFNRREVQIGTSNEIVCNFSFRMSKRTNTGCCCCDIIA